MVNHTVNIHDNEPFLTLSLSLYSTHTHTQSDYIYTPVSYWRLHCSFLIFLLDLSPSCITPPSFLIPQFLREHDPHHFPGVCAYGDGRPSSTAEDDRCDRDPVQSQAPRFQVDAFTLSLGSLGREVGSPPSPQPPLSGQHLELPPKLSYLLLSRRHRPKIEISNFVRYSRYGYVSVAQAHIGQQQRLGLISRGAEDECGGPGSPCHMTISLTPSLPDPLTENMTASNTKLTFKHNKRNVATSENVVRVEGNQPPLKASSLSSEMESHF